MPVCFILKNKIGIVPIFLCSGEIISLNYMTIYVIQGYNYDSNVYLVTGRKSTIIDCGTGLFHQRIESQIRKIVDPSTIQQIILTHEHYDHCGGVKKMIEMIGSRPVIFAHQLASEKIERGESIFAHMLDGKMPKISVDQKLKGEEQLIIGDDSYLCIHTPGHTPGCICLYNRENKTLFSGDTVFSNGSFGRTDFPGGSTQQLINSIKKLTTYDIQNLYPGHENIVEGEGNLHIRSSYQNIKMYG